MERLRFGILEGKTSELLSLFIYVSFGITNDFEWELSFDILPDLKMAE